MFKFFTVGEANAAIPHVAAKFKTVAARRADVIKFEKQMQMAAVPGASLESYVGLKQELNSAMTRFYQAVEDLEATGVSLKNVEQEILDFPSKRFDEEVWLCWKYGETEIKFWHDIESGFMGRKPIEVSDESLV